MRFELDTTFIRRPNEEVQTKEDLDLYKLQSEKLARTVRVLQQDLSSKRSAKEAPRDEWSEQQESIEQILGEFQKKSEQAGGFSQLKWSSDLIFPKICTRKLDTGITI